MKEKSKTKKTRSPQKKKEHGVQTITSMFKKQQVANTSKVNKAKVVMCSSSTDDDDAVLITHTETVSEYFSPKEKTSKFVNKLSLRKRQIGEDDSTSCSTSNRNGHLAETEKINIERCDQTESQAEKDVNVKYEVSDKTVEADPQVWSSSVNTNINSNKKLSLRKRKSSSVEDTSLTQKRLKTNGEICEGSSGQNVEKGLPSSNPSNSRETESERDKETQNKDDPVNCPVTTSLTKSYSMFTTMLQSVLLNLIVCYYPPPLKKGAYWLGLFNSQYVGQPVDQVLSVQNLKSPLLDTKLTDIKLDILVVLKE